MVLDTTADVDEIKGVQDRAGDTRPAANSDEQAKTNDRLGNHAGLTQFVHSTAGTAAESLPANPVPPGVEVLVEYAESNAGSVYLGDSATQKAPLTAVGDGRTFRVSDTSLIYVRTPTAGDSVVVTFES